MDRYTQEIIWSWAMHNIRPWLSVRLDENSARDGFEIFSRSHEMIYLYKISNGTVEILEKPKNISHGLYHAYESRAEYYLTFFRNVVRIWLPSLETVICVAMCDGPISHPFLPTFSFQKLEASTQILIPDIDFLAHNFYEDATFRDVVPYNQKHISAIFSGSTTGGLNTTESVLKKSLPRINAADYFYDRASVFFSLPNIVQYENDEARTELSKLPYCMADYTPWSEQLNHRFLISIDGNGATCSRIKLALSSNSALLKYNSPHKLYYFDFLEPMVHYIPINKHSDVDTCIERDSQDSTSGAAIAAAGRNFAERFLSRQQIEFYMAAVLKIYSSLFDEIRESNNENGYQNLLEEVLHGATAQP